MAMRVLSGHLVTRGVPEGHATIRFSDNTLSGAPPGVGIGSALTAGAAMPASGQFRHKPTFMLAIRELKIVETEWVRGASHEGKEIDTLKIDTTRFDKLSLEVFWSSGGGSEIQEISYMIIGDV